MTTKPVVDLSNASNEDLKQIHSAVLQQLTSRAMNPATLADGYDRHGSGHSRSGGNPMTQQQVVDPANVAAARGG
ncbi:MAG: hypothetical protein JO171_16345 [Paludibacterium sp.]|uniref:hypothetical protein n=1 Tax=Paludibacterium sp. TaxID=1917523 RepID=UPI0025D42CC7|nr:hypothetical protein [Paludibacterium sp.]MBV8048720.1 hypothetical protein [Paludibacterium sp.]MBV8649003.1 hypothetical protein [Paludibacterium sp.]